MDVVVLEGEDALFDGAAGGHAAVDVFRVLAGGGEEVGGATQDLAGEGEGLVVGKSRFGGDVGEGFGDVGDEGGATADAGCGIGDEVLVSNPF
ncbi:MULTISPECIES: hypothetical protein [unclassified Streptomyces]|uniref:hypothetical protein n=1 Tax=Streptomyces sp. T21Q-yed TaxID=3018441 RepID=UPI002365075B|nr:MULTISPECIES: hypothetical protein [unclassified Streptomyces]MDF3139788.1 hypothetical protein [Streptomyces sp. T21Q-yed]WDF42482.1 hypothetical protein PBV52_39645 [Streptomyces sp. T12]